MSKEEVFNRLKQLKFSKDMEPVLALIEKNLTRVEFVKDHHSLRNFVFLAEKDAYKFDYPYFACFNLDLDESNPVQNFVAANQKANFKANDILKEVAWFFEKETEPLYVEIGFKMSMPTQEEQFRVYALLKEKVCANIHEAIMKVRKFPDWYEAKFSAEIQNETEFHRKMVAASNRLKKQLLADLSVAIDKALLNNDESAFHELAARYKKACKDLR